MIEGVVDAAGVPVVALEVAGREWSATVDTGFNGDLELPYSLGSDLSPQFLGRGLSVLAGGQTIEEDHYIVHFPFDGRVVRALATFVPGDGILIGTGLLREHRLMISFPEGRVLIERE